MVASFDKRLLRKRRVLAPQSISIRLQVRVTPGVTDCHCWSPLTSTIAYNRYQQQHAFAPLPGSNFYDEHHDNHEFEMTYRPSTQSGQTQCASRYTLPPLDIPRGSVVPSRHSSASYNDLYMYYSPGYSPDGYSSSPTNYRTSFASNTAIFLQGTKPEHCVCVDGLSRVQEAQEGWGR
ncbi:hypothetical protein M422DRAFT_273572 [Sphaerobolus stellatus SS14]|uniref:Uncharacterized protein n=1 Tax=Sphaerobolus stellatus (strain SS14) TaxID=990650 RepID=A0A0C9TUI6_SPHS4|nr:hypothetical protein M422DRAFT_273572 [Sphaerobolus stellatus SS14]